MTRTNLKHANILKDRPTKNIKIQKIELQQEEKKVKDMEDKEQVPNQNNFKNIEQFNTIVFLLVYFIRI